MMEPDLFRILADPTRRAVYEQLAQGGQKTVSELTRAGKVSQSAVSQHLAVLRAAGLVSDRKVGRNVRYQAEPEGMKPLFDWMAHYAAAWTRTFDELEDLLRRMDQ